MILFNIVVFFLLSLRHVICMDAEDITKNPPPNLHLLHDCNNLTEDSSNISGEPLSGYFEQLAKVGFNLGASTHKNTNSDRLSQDVLLSRILCDPEKKIPIFGMFGVLDGHGTSDGHTVSVVSASVLENTLLLFQSLENDVLLNDNVEDTVQHIFNEKKLTVNSEKKRQLEIQFRLHLLYMRGEREIQPAFAGGTVMALVLFDFEARKIYVANAGDSHVFGGSNRRLKLISHLHSTKSKTERDRLIEAFLNYDLTPRKNVVLRKTDGYAIELTFSKDMTSCESLASTTASGSATLKQPSDNLYSFKKSSSIKVKQLTKFFINYPSLDRHVDKSETKDIKTKKQEINYPHSIDSYFGRPCTNQSNPDNKNILKTNAKIVYFKTSHTSPEFYCRLGSLIPSRGLGDKKYSPFSMSSTSFLRYDPEIAIYDFEDFDYIVLASDGFFDRFQRTAYSEAYADNVYFCGKDCLPDPALLFDEWKDNEEFRSSKFEAVVEQLEEIATEKSLTRIFGLFKKLLSDDSTSLSQKMAEAIRMSYKNTLSFYDDTSVLMITIDKEVKLES